MRETYTLYELGLMIAFVSFLGFLLENAWLAVTKGFIDNRNMAMPFLLGYGLAIIAFYIVLGTPEHMLLLGRYEVSGSATERTAFYFLCVMVLVSVGEILLGTIMERLCHMEYWNYSWIPLHITKYTSIPTSLGFATIITLFMGRRFEAIMDVFAEMNSSLACVVSIVLMGAMGIDYVCSVYKMHRKQGQNLRWRKELPAKWMFRNQ